MEERYLIRSIVGNQPKPAHAVAYSHSLDNDYLITGSVDRKVRFFDSGTGKAIAICLGHKKSVMVVASSEMGPLGEDPVICSGGREGSLIVWDPLSNFSGRMVQIPINEIRCMAVYQGSETYILVGNLTGQLLLWDLNKDEVVANFEGDLPTHPALT